MNPREFYEMRAKSLIKVQRLQHHVSYKTLALRLEAYGVVMTEQTLINRINRGGFSFSFALMVLAALGEETFEVPKLPVERQARSSPDE